MVDAARRTGGRLGQLLEPARDSAEVPGGVRSALPAGARGCRTCPVRDESFDFAISQYGAALWCDPYRWIPEASRILRPGGRLVFETASPLVLLCYPTDDDDAPADTELHRDHFGMHRFELHRPDGTVGDIEFGIGHGDMIRLLISCGFEIEDLIEIQAPIDGTDDPYVPLAWARRWPSAEVWKVRKRR